MIVSTVAGRIRVRSKRLKSRKIADSIKSRIEALGGVHEVRVNPGAGSVVVSFDTETVDVIALEDRIEAICEPAAKGRKTPGGDISRQLNRATKVGMVSTLGASLIYGVLGQKKPHIAYGSAFVAFAGLHMLKYQSTLLR